MSDDFSCGLLKDEAFRTELSMFADSDEAILQERKDALLLHIADCCDCRQYFMEISKLLSELSDMEEAPLPEGFHESAMKAIKVQLAPRPLNFRMYTSIAAAFIGTLMILSVGISGVSMMVGRNAATGGIKPESAQTQESGFLAEGSNSTAAPFGYNGESNDLKDGVSGKTDLENTEAANGLDMQKDVAAAPAMRASSPAGRASIHTLGAATAGMTVKEYSFEILTGQFDEVRGQIEALAGMTMKSSLSNYGNASAVIVKSVDSAQFGAAADYIRGLGTVLSESVSERRVYSYIADTEARLTAKQEEYERVMRLYSLTNSIDEMMQLEYQLSNMIAEMENFKGQINYWNNSASNSVINVIIVEKQQDQPEPPPEELSERVSESFTLSVNATVSVFENLAVGLAGIILPLSIIAVPVAIVLLIVKVIKNRKRKGV